jgi:NAD-dependent deacetylase
MESGQEAASLLARSRYAVVLTGAGISVESGIPDFRSAGGLWSRFDPMEYGHIDSFRSYPGKVWKMLFEMDRLLNGAAPNPAHFAIAELERRGRVHCVITQNVDSLHQRAGSRNVIEFHGNGRTLRCDRCGEKYGREELSLETMPPTCRCGGPIRPDFVFFGEDIPVEAYRCALQAARRCDLMLVVGTSASVAPASHLPRIAKEGSASLVLVNPETTDLPSRLVDLHVSASAGTALPAIVEELDRMGVT